MLQLRASQYVVVMDSDSTYTLGAADNNRAYQHAYYFGEEGYRPSSWHSLCVLEEDGEDPEIASCVLLACGGATGMHEHSALIHQDSCVVAVGPFLCSLSLPSLGLEWHRQVDWATCFGVYHSEKHGCYLSHGELTVARLSYGGEVAWEVSGKEIYTNGFELHEDYVEVVDWDDDVYHIEIPSGVSRRVAV